MLLPDEVVMKHGQLEYLKSRVNLIQGLGHVTNQRFVHTNDRANQVRGGIATTLMSQATQGRVTINLPLGAIARISRVAYNRKKVILQIETFDRVAFKLLTPSVEEWLEPFRSALWWRHQVQLAEVAPGVWNATRA